MRGKLFLITLLSLLLSCNEEELPSDIFHHQVERLLSGQSGTKTWSAIVNSSNCIDSLKITFELVENQSDDSLDITEINYLGDCSTQEVYVGRASASKLGEEELFTDSLIFASGEYWEINRITSEILNFSQDGTSSRFVFK